MFLYIRYCQLDYNRSTTKMKLSYTRLQPFKSSHSKEKLTSEQRFWRKYDTSLFQTCPSTVSAISSNNNSLNIIAYAFNRTVAIHDPAKGKIVKEITTFNNPITSLCLRPDGAVFAAADESGSIQVMDTKQKFKLRTFRNHQKRVNALEYLGNDLYSGGDDFILRHYDVASGQVVHSYEHAHSDYIKAIKALEDHHILSAGYDGYARLFDFRVHEKAQLQFEHGEQLEALQVFPSKMTFVSCGGNKVFLWDLRMGKQLFSGCNNKKTVSSVKVANGGARFITASFDQYVKVFRADTFELTYQEKMAAPVHCLDLTNNAQQILLALEGGQLVSKTRGKQSVEGETGQEQSQGEENEIFQWLRKHQEKKFAYNNQYFYRGIYQKAENFDIKFDDQPSRRVSQYDSLLKKFQYKEALLTALHKKNMMIFLSLVDEYVQRGCLQRTIASFTSEDIENVLPNLLPLLHNPKYSKATIRILQGLLSSSPGTSAWKSTLLTHVQAELSTIDSLLELGGILQVAQRNFQ